MKIKLDRVYMVFLLLMPVLNFYDILLLKLIYVFTVFGILILIAYGDKYTNKVDAFYIVRTVLFT